jgi:hypothetical protein
MKCLCVLGLTFDLIMRTNSFKHEQTVDRSLENKLKRVKDGIYLEHIVRRTLTD